MTGMAVASSITDPSVSDSAAAEEGFYVLPTSSAQARLWFLDKMGQKSAYNIPCTLEIRGRLDTAALQLAFSGLIERHETLRTAIVTERGRPVQSVAIELPTPVRIVDLSRPGSSDPLMLALDEARRPFNLERAPLWRAALFVLGPNHHLLCITLHHIITDSQSVAVMLEELWSLYRAAAENRDHGLPEPELQYGDYASWEQDWVQGSVLSDGIEHFKRQVGDATTRLDLPFDHVRGSENTASASIVPFSLPADVSAALVVACRECGVTPFMGALALVSVFLRRYSPYEDFVLAYAAANRSRPEVNRILGLFVNTLLIRARLRDDPTFLEVLTRTREDVLSGLDHAYVPFDKLVEALRPNREEAASSMFSVMFAFDEPQERERRVGDLELTPVSLHGGGAKFDLNIQLSYRTSGEISGFIEFPSALFEISTVEYMADALGRLARSLFGAPNLPISEHLACSPDERPAALLRARGQQLESPPDEPLGILFERIVRRTPDAIALEFGNERLTYSELDARAERIARALRRRGVGPDVVVATAADSSLRAIVAILAVAKSGGAYLPIEPGQPTSRICTMLTDAGARLFITEGDSSAAADSVQQLRLENLLEESDADTSRSSATSANAAYVMYTSGSTGAPKGVIVSQRAVANLVLGSNYLPLGPATRMGQIANLGFDAATFEIWGALLNGGCLIAVERERILSPSALLEAFAQREINTAFMTSALFNRCVDHDPSAVAAIPYLAVGGEAMDPTFVRKVFAAGRPERLTNGYGPTECTTFATFHTTKAEDGVATHVPIGEPLARCWNFILNRHGRIQATGALGELHIGGPGVSRGYLGQPALTASKFVPALGEVGHGQRLYATGDVALLRNNGQIEVHGRRDQQIKLRGFRIELGEVEAALHALPDIRQAAARVHGPSAADRILVGYIVPRGSSSLDHGRLLALLRERLPPYAVPSALVELDALPLGRTGKIDRSQLQPPTDNAVGTGRAGEAPRTPLERIIAEVWTEALGKPINDVLANFFDVGGHSLLLSVVKARLEERLDIELALLDLFSQPTIRALATHIEGSSTHVEARPAIETLERPAEALDGAEIAVIGMACRFPGAPNPEAFWSVLREGRSTITRFSDEELLAAGVPLEKVQDPNYVKAKGVLENAELFDADFFDVREREAMLMDPQHRLFLTVAWEALEHAGYVPETCKGKVGIYGGASQSDYALLSYERGIADSSVDSFLFSLGNERDHLTSRISYKLGFEGPCINIQTGCSTALVAVHLAVRSLLAHECDFCLAGGASITGRRVMGYHAHDNVLSRDGSCRPFDANSQGTVPSDGVGLVVLKRLSDARRDYDNILAIIRASGINSDGSDKLGYVAPSAQSQTRLVRSVMQNSGIHPETIRFIECHGTATKLGDAVEVRALREAFPDQEGYRNCLLSSAKGNIGHTNAAAGIAGLIKTVLALQHQELPPTASFTAPNPELELGDNVFSIARALTPWPQTGSPRRAAVTSLGLGGTNAHVIVEEPPPVTESGRAPGWHLLVLSARSATALERASHDLATALSRDPLLDLADVAYTLQVGRRRFAHRKYIVASSLTEARTALGGGSATFTRIGLDEQGGRGASLWFPGGDAYARGSLGFLLPLTKVEPALGAAFDECAELVRSLFGRDLRAPIQGGARDSEVDAVVSGYCLARLWEAWGVKAQSAGGRGIGRAVAATVGGVLSLEQAFELARLTAVLAEGRAWTQVQVSRLRRISAESRQPPTGAPRLLVGSQGGRLDWHALFRAQETSSSAPTGSVRLVLGPSGAASDDVLAVSLDGDPEATGLAALGELWLRGVEVDWPRLNRDRARKRVALPTYPFEPKRFWFDQLGASAESPNRPKTAAVVRRSPDEVRAWLREVWTQQLGTGDFSDEDNFFDVGGDSLMGLAMLSQIREQFGIRLRIVDVLERRSIAALTTLIVKRMVDETPRAARSSSVSLHAPSPLFLVHPVGGDVACYHRLARYLDRRVIGLEGPEPDADRAAPASVEGIAAVHAETILNEVPSSPLYVAGWSSGGILALEVARQLSNRGRPVAFLGLIDSLFEEPTPVDEQEWLLWQAGRLAITIDAASFRGLGAKESMKNFLDAVRVQRGNASALELEHLMNVTVQHVEALRRYRPLPYLGPAWVLNREIARTRVQGALPPPDSDQIAALLRGSVVVERVPGDHFNLLEEPHVAELALALKRALASVENADSRRFEC